MPDSRFDRLARHVAREYEAKGIPAERANEWGRATAAKVHREQESGDTGSNPSSGTDDHGNSKGDAESGS